MLNDRDLDAMFGAAFAALRLLFVMSIVGGLALIAAFGWLVVFLFRHIHIGWS